VNKYVETEIVNHSLMRHPHIIQFKDVFVTSNFICIVLEYAGTGTLHAYVRRFGHLKESVARWFFQQLAVAVDYCHKKGVANRDIKLENTLLHVRHLQFALCRQVDQALIVTRACTTAGPCAAERY
jgi:serine/threonine-protein kinase SRK2